MPDSAFFYRLSFISAYTPLSPCFYIICRCKLYLFPDAFNIYHKYVHVYFIDVNTL